MSQSRPHFTEFGVHRDDCPPWAPHQEWSLHRPPLCLGHLPDTGRRFHTHTAASTASCER